MKIYQFGHKLIERFNPMDEASRNQLSAEFSGEYEEILAKAKEKKINVEKLIFKEKVILFFDSFWLRYLLALGFPLLVAFFTKKHQSKEDNDRWDEEDETEFEEQDFSGSSKKEKYMALMKMIKKTL